MRYIARKLARIKGCNCQQVNIPYGSILEARDGFLIWQGEELCVDTSQNAYDYFSRDDDGHGRERGALVGAILDRLAPRKQDRAGEHQSRWDKVWADKLCQSYRRPEHEDYWLWNYDFYNAPVEDLRYIAALVGVRL